MAPKKRTSEASKLGGEIIEPTADLGNKRLTRSSTRGPQHEPAPAPAPAPVPNQPTSAHGSDQGQSSNPRPKTDIFIEFCTRDWKFAKKVEALRKAIDAAAMDVNVVTNPAGMSRAGCFEIRTQAKGGLKIISYLNMQRPYKALDDITIDQLVEAIALFLSSNKAKAED